MPPILAESLFFSIPLKRGHKDGLIEKGWMRPAALSTLLRPTEQAETEQLARCCLSTENMLALRAKAEAGWVLAYPAVLSGFLFFRYFKA
uniref:Uncharacterized protein n=1 Tax=Candidatus Kentrum sp. LFY TaxID=2126342 RepID=A0A450WZG9_9GAMM|nr:MAG: hypothetical protein BECKLFY1418C_GA0070996_11198 [Candidatus Kentron sp. LFY]